MRIGELSRQSGVPIDTIRFYETRALLPQPQRSASGYRQFDADDVRRLNFIRRAKALGFTLTEIADLLRLSGSRDDDMANLKSSVADKLVDVDRRLVELQRVRSALQTLLDDCPGHGALHGCPILSALGGESS